MNTILNYFKDKDGNIPIFSASPKRRIVTPIRTNDDGIQWLKEIPEVATASIRTDVFSNPPYFRRLLVGLKEKKIKTLIPRQGWRWIDLSNVKVISCWSKDYELFIREYEKPESVLHDIPLFMFNFTINGDSDECVLENIKTSLDVRFNQLKWLINSFGSDCINVRFDPITHWLENGVEKNNLDEFLTVLEGIETLEVKQLSFSFCIDHNKVTRRMARHNKPLVIKTLEEKHNILRWMMEEAKNRDIILRACCDDGFVGFEHNETKIAKSICVDREIVARLLSDKGFVFGQASRGNRPQCACVKNTDIFGYEICSNACLYCYANPHERAVKREVELEDIK